LEIIQENLFNLLDKDDIVEILRSNYSMVIMEESHHEIKELLKNQGIKFIPPTTLFLHDSTETYLNNKNLVLSKMEGFLEVNYFSELITENLGKVKVKHNDNKNDNFSNFNQQQDDDYLLSNTELLAKQKRQLEEMEREVMNKEIEKKKQDEKLEEEKKLMLKKEMSLKKKVSLEKRNKDSLRKNLLKEPEKSNPECTTIHFRLPDGDIQERRFDKTCKIIELYNFISSLDDVLTEEETEYDIITPFPMKIFDNYDATLEQEGLFPNSMLTVREK
jgi:hypothetical protein